MILKNGKRLDGCSDTVPIGTINPYMGSVAPYGYLICEGQLVNKTTYKELYEICGDTFGTGTTTEFRLPDLRGKTIVGYKEGDSTFGTLGGLLGSLTHAHSTGNHTLTIAEIPAHNHQLESVTGTDDLNFINGDGSFHIQNSDTTVGFSAAKNAGYKYGSTYSTTGGGQAHNHGDTGESSSLQPSLTMSWIVKAFLLMPNQSYVENSLTSTSEINSLSAAKGKELNEKFNNYLPLSGGTITGEIFKNDSTGSTVLRISSEDKDTTVLRISSGVNSKGDKSEYGYSLKYLGTNQGNDNMLVLYADNQTATDQVESYRITQDGSVWLRRTSYNYNNGAIPGVKQSNASTVQDLMEEVRYTNGQMGSVSLSTAYGDITAGWWLYLYIPHRIGGFNGKSNGDNHMWGILIMMGMTTKQGQMYTINLNNGSMGNLTSH